METVANIFLLLVVSNLLLSATSLHEKPFIVNNCGIRSQTWRSVIDGKNAGNCPWHALVAVPVGRYWSRGGGVLINDQWVITTAHQAVNAKNNSEIIIFLGRQNQGATNKTIQKYSASDIRLHQNYSVGPKHINDIALVRLDRRVTFTQLIGPICLPLANDREAVGTKCYLTGWGAKRHLNAPKRAAAPGLGPLQEVELPVVDFKRCNRSYMDNRTHLCTGYGASSNKSGCLGDSGGPFSCLENGRYYLRGVQSGVQDDYCRTVNDSFTVFTRVSVYIDWINKQMTTPPTTYKECVDNHWACCKFAKSTECKQGRRGLGYYLRYKLCPITCHNPKC